MKKLMSFLMVSKSTQLMICITFFTFFLSLQGMTLPNKVCISSFTESHRNTPPLKDSINIAAVQYPLGEKMSAVQFFNKVDHYLSEAKSGGAELVVFPELITLELIDWSKDSIPQLKELALNFFPHYKNWIQEKAKEKNLLILGGTTPRWIKNQIVNTAILAFPDGRVEFQDKIFLTSDEVDWGWIGGDQLNVFETSYGRLVVTTCFDCEFPLISNLLSDQTPDLILIPSWTSTLAGLHRVEWPARARAIEHFAIVVKTGTVPSPDSTQTHFGQASIITPQDGSYAQEPTQGELNQPSIVFQTLNLADFRRIKSQSNYHPGKKQVGKALKVEVH